ncbi:MAG: FAD-dependent monooxygenase [Bacteroidia bacterium]|nr:FAD-dependent monooxygenase [Bacteroidia bacterium]
MINDKLYDCSVLGGGLAGLCLAIQLAQQGHSVVLIEKNTYPFHKVCGEYVSMESWNFLIHLGLPLHTFNLPHITNVQVTAQNGYTASTELDMGAFGISRYTLDYELSKLAKQAGVQVIENCKVTDVKLTNEIYYITTTQGNYIAKLSCGSYGKITPAFITKPIANKGSYIGVKYHIKTNFPADVIALHNFKDGYCGISKIDNNTFCLCYLTTTKNLQNNNNDIKLLEKNVLMQNPHLYKLFNESTFLFDKPLAISNISFNIKSTYVNDVLMLGDAAGAIAPLCGNGMSISMRASKILANNINDYLQNKITKQQLITNYTTKWNASFSVRIKIGYYLQQLFGKRVTTLWSLKLLNNLPFLFKKIVSLTHGKSF